MINPTLLFLSSLLFIACNDSSIALSGVVDSISETDARTSFCEELPFRFVVLKNEAVTTDLREIQVFLDPTAFSVENLRELFSHLSKRNPEPGLLQVSVITDWEQLGKWSDCSRGGIGGTNNDSNYNKFHRARYYRVAGQEYFRYSLLPTSPNLERVVISGNTKQSED